MVNGVDLGHQAVVRPGLDKGVLKTESVPLGKPMRVRMTGVPLRPTQQLVETRRLAAVPECTPLALRSAVHLADLIDQPVVLCSTAATATADLWPRGRRPRTFQVANVDEWLTTIAAGDAVGVTAQGTEHSHPHPGVTYLPISDAAPVTVRLVRPRTPTHPATSAFIDHLQKVIATTGPKPEAEEDS